MCLSPSKVLEDSRQVLVAANMRPDDPFPMDDKIKEGGILFFFVSISSFYYYFFCRGFFSSAALCFYILIMNMCIQFLISKFIKQTELNPLAGPFWPMGHMFGTPILNDVNNASL